MATITEQNVSDTLYTYFSNPYKICKVYVIIILILQMRKTDKDTKTFQGLPLNKHY